MSLIDSLVITGLGMGVVYIGLILTNLMIYSFSLVPRLEEQWKKHKKKRGESKEKTITPVVNPEPVKEVPSDIVAVIATVLEVEFRLRQSLGTGKLTFK